jgi:hypothetical protein
MTTRNKAADTKILAEAFFNALQIDDCEYGGIGLDSKRPFGNSDVDADILEMIGAEPEGDDGESECWSSHQRDYARSLYHEELIPFLKEVWEEFKAS